MVRHEDDDDDDDESGGEDVLSELFNINHCHESVMAVFIQVSLIRQIDQFKNYLYSILIPAPIKRLKTSQ